ncbi:hypothetical protein C5167_031307 [Papaver somniferum]|uniref:non-specific serine/threonine protein kinase n=1 Tax=Papaver somniferum TaxID=3469 RepID=A0A4Y7K6T6_PAPSO|nr:hypothetical protein C5167_031307 [Papaver somniferum]
MPTSIINHHLLLLLVLLLLPIYSIAQTYRNVTLGLSITSGVDITTWASQNGDFAFGFRPIADNSFLLAIWYAKIPDETVVWFATDGTEYNGDIQIPKGSKVELNIAGQLILSDLQGKQIWSAGENLSGATYAAMLDNGNFVLGSKSSAGYLWESFNPPTDTILPSQSNPDIKQFVFNESGHIYIVSNNGSIVNLVQWGTLAPATNVYYRATLDFHGVFTQYSHPKNTDAFAQFWSIERYIPDNICMSFNDRLGSGACGYNSYCQLTLEGRPICQCPPGFEFNDPDNKFGDCTPNFVLQGCLEEKTRKQNDSFELHALNNVDWTMSDYESLESYNEQDCRSSCLSDCLCAVALFREGTCWKKKLPLPNGRLDVSVNGNALIKIRKDNASSPEQNPNPPISSPKKDRSTLILVISPLLGTSVFFNLIFLARALYHSALLCLLLSFMDKKLRRKKQTSSVLRSNLRIFTYQELEEATDGFKEELGRGAFGIVYKGFIDEMGSVAVKRLDKVLREGEKEFKTEVNVIGQTHHKNLVRLLGFCEEGRHRLLIYEFMSNRSLADHLFGTSKTEWNRRVQISFGISRGLMYMHEECSTQIIHCDIKPQNILLDDNFTARISDFGLAKLLMTNQTQTSTGIRGTRGYVAPEWLNNTQVSAKVDVYSFGVMLLEIICCRKGVLLELLVEGRKAILTEWAYDCFSQGKLEDLVENDEEVMNDMRRFERLVMIAIWCVQDDPSLRPSMKKVTQMLEGGFEVPAPPPGDANTSWRSPSGDFAFGFRPTLQDNNLFFLAIWFDKIPDKTVVWFANDGDNRGDLQIRKGSRVELKNYDKLILNDPQRNELWSAGGNVNYAAMLDNGNFVLGSTSSAEYLWESFNHPTDTILPTQELQANSGVYSRETNYSYSKGRFRLRLREDGYLVLNVAAYPSSTESNYNAYYYFSRPFNNDGQEAGYAAVFNQSGYIYVNIGDGTKVLLSNKTILPISQVCYRATLDFDGFFTQYYHPRSKNVEQVWSKCGQFPTTYVLL